MIRLDSDLRWNRSCLTKDATKDENAPFCHSPRRRGNPAYLQPCQDICRHSHSNDFEAVDYLAKPLYIPYNQTIC